MGIPLPSLAINSQQPNPLEQYGKALSIKGLMQQQQFQQQEQPQLLEQQRQATQEGAINLQMKQLALKNTQIAQGAFSDPNFMKDFKAWQENKGAAPQGGAAGSTTALPLHPLAQFLAENKGLPMFGPGGALEMSQNLTAATQKQAELIKTQGEGQKAALDAHERQLNNFDNIAEPVLAEKDPQRQQQALMNMQTQVQQHPDLYPPEAIQNPQKFSTVQGLQEVANGSQIRQMLIKETKDQAEATKAQQGVIPAGGGLSPEAQQGVAKDIAVATNPQIQQGKVSVAAAEGAARANVEAQVARGGNAALANVPTHLIPAATADATKAGTDYAQAQSVTQRLNAMMDAAKKGNVVSYQLIPQEGALQLTTSQGVHRINMAEIQNYGGGSIFQRMEGHFGKALTGKSIPESVLNDMAEMQKIQEEGARSKYENSLKTINQNYGSSFKPIDMGNAPTAAKTLTQAQVQKAATDHGVSVEEATRQAKAAGYNIQ